MTVGEKLKLLRTDHNKSLRQLSEITGLSKSTLSDIENNRKNPSLDTIEKIAKAFQISSSTFLLETDSAYDEFEQLEEIKKSPTFIHYLRSEQQAEEQFIEIIAPKLLKDGWSIERCKENQIADIIAKKDNTNWFIEFKNTKRTTNAKNTQLIDVQEKNLLFQIYGRIATYNEKPITKFTIATSNKKTYKVFTKTLPTHLDIPVSFLYVDFDKKSISAEFQPEPNEKKLG